MDLSKLNSPFPLKKYYLLYGGIGSFVFYVLLFLLFINAERNALYDEYIHSVSEKAKNMYQDIIRDFLEPNKISISDIENMSSALKSELREEIDDIVNTDFSLMQIKLFRSDALTLYDHNKPENEGSFYSSRNEEGFTGALKGSVESEIEVEDDGKRLMEAYLPIVNQESGQVTAILEIYEDVSRFENQVKSALKEALVLPSVVFIVFNVLLFLLVSKADRIITDNTNLLLAIRKNMEKYISKSAVSAISKAVSESKELFKGERQSLIVFFTDIRNFTAYSEKTSPEEVVNTINRLFQIQAEIIDKYGGVIDKFVGDEIMVTFDAGQEEKAVNAAMDIIKAVHSSVYINDLKVGIGIHSGEVVVGSIGTVDRRDYTAIGDTVNVGARLCDACPGNGIYISSSIYKKLNKEIINNFKYKKYLNLKGKKDPLEAFLFKI